MNYLKGNVDVFIMESKTTKTRKNTITHPPPLVANLIGPLPNEADIKPRRKREMYLYSTASTQTVYPNEKRRLFVDFLFLFTLLESEQTIF